jgi:hypothetical protein
VIAGSVNNGVLCAGKAAWLFALRAMSETAVNDFGTNDSIMNKYATRRVWTDIVDGRFRTASNKLNISSKSKGRSLEEFWEPS